MGASKLLKKQLIFIYFSFRERGTVVLFKAVPAFLGPGRTSGCGRKAEGGVGSLLEFGRGPQNSVRVSFGVFWLRCVGVVFFLRDIWGFSGSVGPATELKTKEKILFSGCSNNCFLSVWECSGWLPRCFRELCGRFLGLSGRPFGLPGRPSELSRLPRRPLLRG